MHSTATLTPFVGQEATQIGRQTFRKQVLPLGHIMYEGRRIDFDKQYLTDLAQSFNDGAYDQVPLVWASGDNAHNESPDNFRGEVKGFELSDDGLDAIIEASPEGVKVLKDNPKLGISARIVEGVSKADGRQFPRAIRHVLATLFPRVPNMRPWQAVDLSEDTEVDEVVDLTTLTFQGGTVGIKTKTGTVGIDLSRLDDKQFEALLDLAEAAGVGETGAELTQEELDALEAEANGEGGAEGEADPADEEPELDENGNPIVKDKTKTAPAATKTKKVTEETSSTPVPVGAGAPAGADLSETLRNDTNDRFRAIENKLAGDRWAAERRTFIQDGVPPFLVDLAAPVLASPDTITIDLSDTDGKTVKHDATKIVRSMLEGVRGIVDLHPEVGHAVDLSDQPTEDPNKALMDQWDDQYPV